MEYLSTYVNGHESRNDYLGRKLVAEGEGREGGYVGIMVRVDDASG